MTKRIFITGIVQGVGFRPCCKKLADQMQLSGTVRNLGANAEIVIRSDNRVTEDFLCRLVSLLPDTARIDSTEISDAEEFTGEGFTITQSDKDESLLPEIIPDISTCDDCLSEMNDKDNRRYLHPFISCTVCGPRYSIIKKLPYDRENTLMDHFSLCPKCKVEYTDLYGKRLHAQTIACKDCGPSLYWFPENETVDPLLSAAAQIKNGGVIAVKDIGGYHFVCSPFDIGAVKRLRELKLRDAKPFAVMFPNTDSVKEFGVLCSEEERLLKSPARPIVLIEKNKDFCEGVCDGSRFVGAMLPSNPVQYMLSDLLGPLIMTSGNISGEPIITENSVMLSLAKNSSYLDGVLYHDRDIITSLDDSIYYVVNGKSHIMRRGRGVAPSGIPINLGEKTIFAAGGDLKSCFGFYKSGKAVLSQHFGDLVDTGCAEVYSKTAAHISSLYNFTPDVTVCDMHPMYFSSNLPKKLFGKTTLEVQHHHAHIASVMAEHNLDEVLGFAFDGTGYGPDNTIWGGEVLYCKGAEYKRVAHLKSITMCGGDEAAKNAAQALACLCSAAEIKPPAQIVAPDDAAIISAAIKMRLNCVDSSSCGRLFDAVCALLEFGSYNSFEGECALKLENAANYAIKQGAVAYPLVLDYNNGILDTPRLIKDIAKAKQRGVGPFSLALGFHIALSEALYKVAKTFNIKKIALSGGTFNNRILLSFLTKRLSEGGFEVYTNEKVPCGDGGIALGQLFVAGRKE